MGHTTRNRPSDPAPLSPPPPGALGIPGPFPGRVVQVNHTECLTADGRIDQAVAGRMLSEGLCRLTDTKSPAEAWRRFFAPGDRVGLKVNCVGHPVDDPAKHAVHTSHEILREIVATLRGIGVTDILIFDRYRAEFQITGYDKLAAELQVPWATAAVSWDRTQIDMDGYSAGDPNLAEKNGAARTDGSQKMAGYDPDVFITQDFISPVHDPADPRTRRSHVTRIVTQRVDKIVNLCLIKDHAAAGITGALKNLSHGLVDNVVRSHASTTLNQTATFIPAVVAAPIIRRKVVLNVMEGFRGIYEGGPWASPHVFEPRTLLVSTDPVAMDRIALEILDARRAEAGLPPLARAGQAGAHPDGEHHLFRGTTHVELSAALGLGVHARTPAEFGAWYARKPPADGGRPVQTIEHQIVALG